MAHHAAAKAALDNYGKALAAGLAPAGIRVTVIMPGNVLTPGADEVRQSFDDAMGVELAAVTADIPPGAPETLATSPKPSPTSSRTERSGSPGQA